MALQSQQLISYMPDKSSAFGFSLLLDKSLPKFILFVEIMFKLCFLV